MTIGRFVCESSERTKLWRDLGPPSGTPRTYASPEDVPSHLLLEPPDAQTHLDLAFAYREMNLPSDAVLEAAEALRLGKLTRERASLAMQIVLDPAHLLERAEFALYVIRNSFQN